MFRMHMLDDGPAWLYYIVVRIDKYIVGIDNNHIFAYIRLYCSIVGMTF